MVLPCCSFFAACGPAHRVLRSFPTRRSSDLDGGRRRAAGAHARRRPPAGAAGRRGRGRLRSEEHTSELQSRGHLVCRLLLEKKNTSGEKVVKYMETPLVPLLRKTLLGRLYDV